MLFRSYPNPTTGILTVEFTAAVAGDHQITVTDLSGRLVADKVVKAVGGSTSVLEMDLSVAGEGFYMLYIRDPKGSIAVSKVTVE